MVHFGKQYGKADSYSTFAKKNVVTPKQESKMTSIKARLNRSHIGKDGMYPLGIQVIHRRTKCIVSTPYRLKRSEFNPLSEKASADGRNKVRSSQIREINAYIAEIKNEIEKVVHSLTILEGNFTVYDITRVFKIRTDKSNFFTYADSRIAGMKQAGRDSTAANYQSAIHAFEHYLGNRELSLNGLTKSILDGFMDFRKQQGNKPNTVVFYVRQLRAIYNKAYEDGYVEENVRSPFDKVRLKGEETAKRAISRQEVGEIRTLDLKGQHPQKVLARDLFLFSLFSRGMSFVDMCYLKKENRHGDMLVYRRRKTGQLLQLRIEPALKALLVKYRDENSDYLLPMLRKDDSYEGYRYVQRRLNKRMRELGRQLGFHFPLTFYVARHTWATMARDKGFPLSAISAGMGHTCEQTTRVYLAHVDHRVIDRMNSVIIKNFIGSRS